MCKPAKRKRSAALSDFLWGLLSGGIVIAVSWFSHTFGQKKAYNQKRNQPIYGNRKDIKKAYVTLKEGDKISVFEDIE